MTGLFKNVYKGKKVFVTGHTGFKGSWLALWLLEMGADVVGYSLEAPTNPSLFEALELKNRLTHIVGDVRDGEKLKEVMVQEKPDFVFHLAAQPLVRLSYAEPVLTYETNIMGTIHLFEAVRATESVEVLVNVTSDKCYENKEWIYGYREHDAMGGYDPYSSSKGCAELVASSYINSFFNPKDYGKKHNLAVASVRAGNVIGGGDWAGDRLIPDCIRSLKDGASIEIRSPHATRPWQHVLEPLSGYLWIGARLFLENEKFVGGWNFGPNEEDIWNVEKVVQKIISLWGKGEYRVEQTEKLHEAKLLKLDVSKAHFHLGWKPVYKAEEAFCETVNWYKNYYQGKEVHYDFSLLQLRHYVKSAKKADLEWAIKG